MKFDKKTLFIVLAVCYLLIGFFFWSSGQGLGAPFHLFTFVYMTLLWPLVIGMFVFSFIAIPAILGVTIALVLAIKRQYIVATSLIVVFLFLFSSLFIPVTIHEQKELSNVQLGLPLRFVVQDQSHYDPPLPWQVRLGSAAENSTRILWPQFAISFIIVFILIFGILNIFKIIYCRQRKTCHACGRSASGGKLSAVRLPACTEASAGRRHLSEFSRGEFSGKMRSD
ncbi:MAG: hypothetical protein Q8N16_04235 [bacterium]|nr:hypothetical protein [bacterium]